MATGTTVWQATEQRQPRGSEVGRWVPRVGFGAGTYIAGIEFIVDQDGVAYTYDINTNTNYNSEAEAAAGQSGMGAVFDYLGHELEAVV